MKIWTFSDLHLSYSGPLGFDVEFPEADVCVVAGDVLDPPIRTVKWLQDNIGHRMPVVAVAGNHEYYGREYTQALAEVREKRHLYPDVHFLENESVEIGGVRFLGATLWTDFNLQGTPWASMTGALRGMNDYRMIRFDLDEPLTPAHTVGFFESTTRWMWEELAAPFGGKTIVVTHTAPHCLSIHPGFAGDPYNAAFASDLSDLMSAFQPDLWLHGHTHSNFDYVVPETRTRVVCNPRGYVRMSSDRGLQVENMDFDSAMVVEV